MLILSQNGEELFNFDNIGIMDLRDRTDGTCSIHIISGVGDYYNGATIGTYASKARAAEVLLELCNAFNIVYVDKNHRQYTKRVFKMPAS